jgi:hypothetical protein
MLYYLAANKYTNVVQLYGMIIMFKYVCPKNYNLNGDLKWNTNLKKSKEIT